MRPESRRPVLRLRHRGAGMARPGASRPLHGAALELQPEGSALLSAAVQEQDIGHHPLSVPTCAHFRQGEGSFDVCACNPPYFTDGPQSQNAAHALARHENTCTLDDVCQPVRSAF